MHAHTRESCTRVRAVHVCVRDFRTLITLYGRAVVVKCMYNYYVL